MRLFASGSRPDQPCVLRSWNGSGVRTTRVGSTLTDRLPFLRFAFLQATAQTPTHGRAVERPSRVNQSIAGNFSCRSDSPEACRLHGISRCLDYPTFRFPNALSARPSIALSISIVIRSYSLSFPASAAVKASIGERPRLSSLQATSASIHSRFPGGISDCLDYASCTALPGHSSPVRSLTRTSNVLSSLTSIPSDVGCPLRQRRTLLP